LAVFLNRFDFMSVLSFGLGTSSATTTAMLTYLAGLAKSGRPGTAEQTRACRVPAATTSAPATAYARQALGRAFHFVSG
jgi:hypothetical protein|tara:strand:+ start:444 stop:680 length:237 start_codon:yes stop_codon:yes gene_type:complete